jgi:hypothetical protein
LILNQHRIRLLPHIFPHLRQDLIDKPPLLNASAAAPVAEVEVEVGKPVPVLAEATSDERSSGMIAAKTAMEEPVSVGEFSAL